MAKRLAGNGTPGVFPAATPCAKVSMMEPTSPAEELPALYRALLDRVAQIEADGSRAAAYRLRSEATRIYSKSWDDRARRALQDLLNSDRGRPGRAAGTRSRVATEQRHRRLTTRACAGA